MEQLSSQEQQLCQFLLELPARHSYRYTDAAAYDLVSTLFTFLYGGRDAYRPLFFPHGNPPPSDNGTIRLSDAQGAVDGAEYTEAARGTACGHIFKCGEATYTCKTCSDDDTCCLCARCYESTDHTGHVVRVSVSPGNSGCCDCGDPEAWKRPVFCTIHSEWEHHPDQKERDKGKGKQSDLPQDLQTSIRMTIERVLDYICDVISCSPEQMRLAKTVESIRHDEKMSRLGSTYHGGDTRPAEEFCICLWNDEKHTVTEVQDQVARACRVRKSEGLQRAYETDLVGRSILMHDESIEKLLDVAKVLDQIRITITIRSSRDTFREQMCGAMIEWLNDVVGCTVGPDARILRNSVCEAFLQPWRIGSSASHAEPGKGGIDDEDTLEQNDDPGAIVTVQQLRLMQQARAVIIAAERAQDDSDDGDDAGGDDATPSPRATDLMDDDDVMMLDAGEAGPATLNRLAEATEDGVWPPNETQTLEEDEATMAGYPRPPPPPPVVRRAVRDGDMTPSDSDTGEPLIPPAVYAKTNLEVPRTPGVKQDDKTKPQKPVKYWLTASANYLEQENGPIAENLFQRIRLDWTILFDVRLWKKLRIDLRNLYISTVVTLPRFKRILGLRFAGLFPTLAQLYLIADREPDHSIVNLSLQMLTTRSITAEVVERGNFLTSLMAILYTFLTTRQVGHPWNVSPAAVLAFDTGSVTNRRMYHFFTDMKYLFNSPDVQERLLVEERYVMQFLDLVKLHQGICPNVRAVGDHVEYEADTWINASLIVRDINRLCRLFSQSYHDAQEEYILKAVRLIAKQVVINSIGAERERFTQAEIKDEVSFKALTDFEFDEAGAEYSVVKFVVEDGSLSFHHALHYTLSWLIECGKALPIEHLRAALGFTTQDLRAKPQSMGRKAWPRKDYDAEDYLMAMFDYPLRVCAWLAQMKTQMWIRNGISLRHQMASYRGIIQRDTSHHRDIFMLQAALVICNPSRVLASVIDRFGMEKWVKGIFEQKATAQDDAQHLDVVEDMIHLLIVLLSDRNSLLTAEDEPDASILALRRDLIHVLCFKPLAFTEICSKLPEKYHEHDRFQAVLEELSNYKAPEGASDAGTFELKPQFLEEVEPFIAHYNKNQREESEAAWRKHMAAKTGKSAEDLVYEPRIRPIRHGIFADLAAFTRTGMFAQLIYYCLLYSLVRERLTPKVQATRVETYLQLVLHLILIAIQEDSAPESDPLQASFINIALTRHARSNFMPEVPNNKSIVSLLEMMSTNADFKACQPRIQLILKRMRQKRPRDFEQAFFRLGVPVDRVSTASPANNLSADEERERKKQAALARAARVKAQFQNQQKAFLANQDPGLDWGDVDQDLEDDDAVMVEPVETATKLWKYPKGTCIYCQESLDDKRLFGTFAFISETSILRQTDLQDADYVREAASVPKNLDRSAESIRPFGVAGQNRQMVAKVNAQGETFMTERQVMGKGFPTDCVRAGPVSVGCGHVMHYACFESHNEAIKTRHKNQVARHHPEDHARLEFVCPLCKALGNAFLPIIWASKAESYPGALTDTVASFDAFVNGELSDSPSYALGGKRPADRALDTFKQYTTGSLADSLADDSAQLLVEAWQPRRPATPASSSYGSDSFVGINTPDSSSRSVMSLADDASGPGGGSAGGSGSGAAPMRELVQIYHRLRDTMRKNELCGPQAYPYRMNDRDLAGSDVLARTVGFSISALEIQHRGTDVEYGSTLLEKISEQTLSHLRILAETATSYIAVGCQKDGGTNVTNDEFRRECERQHCQLFMGRYLAKQTDNARSPVDNYVPLLSLDMFVFFCETIYGVGFADRFDVAHLLRLCYLAEVVKTVYHISRNIDQGAWFNLVGSQLASEDPSTRLFAEFCRGIIDIPAPWQHLQSDGDNLAFAEAGFESLAQVRELVRTYAQVFLRKCVILLYVKYGVDFNSRISPEPEKDELDRLTEALRVPTFDEMLSSLAPLADGVESIWPSLTKDLLVKGWITHQIVFPRTTSAGDSQYDNPIHYNNAHLLTGYAHLSQPSVSDWSRTSLDRLSTEPTPRILPPPRAMLSHPGIYELIGLPMNYDVLIGETIKQRCPTTGKDLTDPMLCLICGDVFCGQAICCQAEDPTRSRMGTGTRIGGAQQHMRRCQKNCGLFLNIRKCATFFLYRGSGSFGQAPFIDKYGETDMNLRHGRQLFLSQRRYDSMLRSLWLSHGVPSYICRRLEAEINNGGWETL